VTMILVKIGGSIHDKLGEFDIILDADLIVHGGSRYIDELCRRVGLRVEKLVSPSGIEYRRTTREVLDIYVMAISKINLEIVRYLLSRGVPAIGLTGMDLGIVRADRKRIVKAYIDGRLRVYRDDYSGRIRHIDTDILERFMDIGVPVIAPIAYSEGYEPLNIDGDTLAGEISKALGVDKLIFLTDRALEVDGEIVKVLTSGEIPGIIGRVSGGMRRKLLVALDALRSGVGSVEIIGLNGSTVLI